VTWGDWIIGGAGLSNVGASTVQTAWGTDYTCVTATPSSFVLVGEPSLTAPTAITAPGVGEVTIMEVMGSLFFRPNLGNTTAMVIDLAVAIYVAEQYPTARTNWSVRDPLNAADAARDDYLFLRGMQFTMAAPTAGATVIEVRLAIPKPETIGGGEALVCTVSTAYTTSAGSTLVMTGYVRSRIGRAS
jgi:hypothetical protein